MLMGKNHVGYLTQVVWVCSEDVKTSLLSFYYLEIEHIPLRLEYTPTIELHQGRLVDPQVTLTFNKRGSVILQFGKHETPMTINLK